MPKQLTLPARLALDADHSASSVEQLICRVAHRDNTATIILWFALLFWAYSAEVKEQSPGH